MAIVPLSQTDSSEAAIFGRLWESKDAGLTPELARHVLKLDFSARDKARMHELAVKNNAGVLAAAELEALDNYVRVGDLIAILQSKARKLLKQSTRKSSGHR